MVIQAETSNDDSGVGGFASLLANNIYLKIEGGTFKNHSAKNGGLLYIKSYGTNNFENSIIIMTDAVQISQSNCFDDDTGTILYYLTSDKSKITIQGGSFDSENIDQSGSMFRIINQNDKDIVFQISDGALFSDVQLSETIEDFFGCVFYLYGVEFQDTGNSIYDQISCISGGILYSEEGLSNFEGSTFKNIDVSSIGGVLYVSQNNDGFSFDNCNFINITALYGAIVFDPSSCDSIMTKSFSLCTFTNISASQQVTVGYFNSSNCDIVFEDCNLDTVYLNSSSNDFSKDNLIKIINANSLTIQNVTISNFEYNSSDSEVIFYINEIKDFEFSMIDSKITCQKEHSSQREKQTFTSILYYPNGKSFTSSNNQIQNCNYGLYGMYYLKELESITDKNSIYKYNSAQNFGVYQIIGDTTNGVTVTIKNCKFSHNYGISGGVIGINDYFNLAVTSSMFYMNSAIQGGVLSIQRLSQPFNISNFYSKSSTYSNNTSSSQGGSFYFDHPNFKAYFSNQNVFENNYSPTGGVFFIQNMIEFSIDSCTFQNNDAEDSSIIFCISTSIDVSIKKSTFFQGIMFEYNKIMNFVENSLYKRTTSMYFSSANSKVTCYSNTYENHFFNQRGGVFHLEQVQFSDSFSTYKNNSAYLGGSIVCSKCVLISKGNIFELNIANQGGVIYLDNDASFTSENDQFIQNTAITYGGGFFATTRTTFSINKAKFLSNYANDDSAISAIFTSTTNHFLIKNCLFQNNEAKSNTISLKNSNGLITKSQFINNKATIYTGNIFLSFSTVNITDSTFSNQESTTQLQKQVTVQGQFIYLSLGVKLKIDKSTFSNGYARQGGAIFVNGLSDLSVSNSVLNNNYAEQNGGAVYSTGYESISFLNTNFLNNQAKEKGSEYYSLFSDHKTYFRNVQIFNSSPVSSIYADTISLDTYNLVINGNNGKASTGGGITCMSCGTLNIVQSQFLNLKSSLGGAIYIEQLDSSKISTKTPTYNVFISIQQLQITQSIFKDCESYQGGGIFISNAEYLILLENRFIQNLVRNNSQLSLSGVGGALYFKCITYDNCRVDILKGNDFQNNSAENSGGGIQWDDNEPKFDNNNIFINNSAHLYGNDIASFAQKIIKISKEEYENQQLKLDPKKNKQRKLELISTKESATTSQNMQSQQSGGILPTSYLALADKYNQIVGNTNTAKLTVRVDITYNANNPTSLVYAPVLEGSSQFVAQAGVFNVSGIGFAGSPGSNYKIVFETDGIDNTKPSNLEYLNSVLTNTSKVDFPIFIELRECNIGESFSDAGKCTECKNGTFYLLNKLSSPGNCETCPSEKAICLGGSNIGPQPGYWRKNNYTENFIKCPNVFACLGIQYPNYNPKGDCADTYEGMLCAECKIGYSKTNQFKCLKCPEKTKNSIRLLFIFIAVIIAIIWLVRQIIA